MAFRFIPKRSIVVVMIDNFDLVGVNTNCRSWSGQIVNFVFTLSQEIQNLLYEFWIKNCFFIIPLKS